VCELTGGPALENGPGVTRKGLVPIPSAASARSVGFLAVVASPVRIGENTVPCCGATDGWRRYEQCRCER